VALADGSLCAVAPGYRRAVTFQPATGKRTSLGETMSVHSMLPMGEKLYLCGYAGSMVWVYDPAQPWTAGKAADAPPTDPAAVREQKATRDPNPAEVASLKEFTDVHMAWGAAAGADGRIYIVRRQGRAERQRRRPRLVGQLGSRRPAASTTRSSRAAEDEQTKMRTDQKRRLSAAGQVGARRGATRGRKTSTVLRE
jgi:hypothetical protein